MQLGMVGLGRMGANMVRRLMRGGHHCVVFDLNPEHVARLVQEGATGAASIEEFLNQLSKPRAVWAMVPAGDPTEETVMGLAQRMTGSQYLAPPTVVGLGKRSSLWVRTIPAT